MILRQSECEVRGDGFKLAYASDSIKPPALAGGENAKSIELAYASDRR